MSFTAGKNTWEENKNYVLKKENKLDLDTSLLENFFDERQKLLLESTTGLEWLKRHLFKDVLLEEYKQKRNLDIKEKEVNWEKITEISSFWNTVDLKINKDKTIDIRIYKNWELTQTQKKDRDTAKIISDNTEWLDLNTWCYGITYITESWEELVLFVPIKKFIDNPNIYNKFLIKLWNFINFKTLKVKNAWSYDNQNINHNMSIPTIMDLDHIKLEEIEQDFNSMEIIWNVWLFFGKITERTNERY